MKKNLLYIFADQWNKNIVGFENKDVLTPNIDKFARKSLVFNNAISTYPLCSPHRASLLTGKYPYSLGLWTNCKIGLDEIVMLKPQEITIGDVLKSQGYDTAYIGKWHLDASEMNFDKKSQSGAENWDAYTPPGERRHSFDFWFSYGAMDNHLEPHYWKDSCKQIKENRWSPEVETDIALEFLENRNLEKPFCLFLSWNPPHPPYEQVPDKFYNMYKDKNIELSSNVPWFKKEDMEYIKNIKQYYGAVSGLDEQFGKIIEYLNENNLMEDTVIVLSSDHGDMLGAHGLMGKNVWYEGSINIPLMIFYSGVQAKQTDVLIGSQDHMPTILDILDIDIPNTVEGCSVIGEVIEQSQKLEDEKFIMMIPGMPDMVDKYRKKGLNHKCFGWRGIRGRDYTYVVDNGTEPNAKQRRYFYDLKEDTLQLNPIELSIKSQKTKLLDEILKGYLDKTNDPFIL